MKTRYLFSALTFITAALITISCSSVRKTAIDCPDIQQNRYYRAQHRTAHKNITAYSAPQKRTRKITYLKSRPVNQIPSTNSQVGENRTLFIPEKAEYRKSLTAAVEIPSGRRSGLVRFESPEILVNNIEWSANNSQETIAIQGCDTIVLKSGVKYIGKVEEIGLTEVKYRRCTNLTGPVISVLKSDVNVIKYSNGTNDYFTSNDYIPSAVFTNSNNYQPDVRKNQGLGVAGFVTSLAGLFIFSIPLGVLSVIFGAVSLGKIKRERRFKGKGFAIAAIIIGLVDVIAMILLLGSVAAV